MSEATDKALQEGKKANPLTNMAMNPLPAGVREVAPSNPATNTPTGKAFNPLTQTAISGNGTPGSSIIPASNLNTIQPRANVPVAPDPTVNMTKLPVPPNGSVQSDAYNKSIRGNAVSVMQRDDMNAKNLEANSRPNIGATPQGNNDTSLADFRAQVPGADQKLKIQENTLGSGAAGVGRDLYGNIRTAATQAYVDGQNKKVAADEGPSVVTIGAPDVNTELRAKYNAILNADRDHASAAQRQGAASGLASLDKQDGNVTDQSRNEGQLRISSETNARQAADNAAQRGMQMQQNAAQQDYNNRHLSQTGANNDRTDARENRRIDITDQEHKDSRSERLSAAQAAGAQQKFMNERGLAADTLAAEKSRQSDVAGGIEVEKAKQANTDKLMAGQFTTTHTDKEGNVLNKEDVAGRGEFSSAYSQANKGATPNDHANGTAAQRKNLEDSMIDWSVNATQGRKSINNNPVSRSNHLFNKGTTYKDGSGSEYESEKLTAAQQRRMSELLQRKGIKAN